VIRDATRLVAEAALSEVRRGFASSSDPYGKPWTPSNGFGGRTLEDTRRLHNSFTEQVVGPGRFRIGTNVRFAATHQYGATIKPVHAKLLVFEVPFAHRIAVVSRGKRRAKKFGRSGTSKNLVFAKRVVVPRRQMVPEEQLGPIWTNAFARELEALLGEIGGRT
jgi:phage gpG-like protein